MNLLCDVDKVHAGLAVPLFWLNHVKSNQLAWPIPQFNKSQGILTSNGAAKLLLPPRNYVFARRFSAKEEPRRLVAAPFISADYSYPLVGLENHLNYLYKKQGALSVSEAFGLAAILNSALMDRYFRIVNGNTQVNATELRRLPLPPMSVIEELGSLIKESGSQINIDGIEHIALSTLRKHGCLPDDLPNLQEAG